MACRGLTRMFPCKKSHPDPRTTWKFCHFRQGFKHDSQIRRLGWHFATPNTGTAFGVSLKPAPTRLQMRFPHTETVFEASLKSALIRLLCTETTCAPKAVAKHTDWLNNVQVAWLVMDATSASVHAWACFCAFSQYSSKSSSGVGKW